MKRNNRYWSGELPRVVWYDSEGREHYSVCPVGYRPAPWWLSVLTALALLAALVVGSVGTFEEVMRCLQ